MTNAETLVWAAYIAKHGTFNTGVKVEQGAALTAYMSGKSVKKGARIEDFMPRRSKPKKQTDDEMLKAFMSAARLQNGDN